MVWVADNKRVSTSTHCIAQRVSTVRTQHIHNNTTFTSLSLLLTQAMNTNVRTLSPPLWWRQSLQLAEEFFNVIIARWTGFGEVALPDLCLHKTIEQTARYMHEHTRTHTRMRAHTHTHIRTHARTYTHTHTHTHTHTYTEQ